MELGEKLHQARLAAGLSQRQLCGTEITRNMLSQIEHGTARPSMTTLQYLAGQLSLPVSYFLDEEAAVSGNASCMQQAWEQFESGNPAESFRLTEDYRAPDPIYDREYRILRALVLLELARKSMVQGREIYCRELLGQVEALEPELPWLPEIRTRRLELSAALGSVSEEAMPSLDLSLLLHAAAALNAGNTVRAIHLLDAVQDQDNPRWQLLRGRTALAEQSYGTAAKHLANVEELYPKEVVPLLEICFREMGDYQMAYHYACKAR